MIETLDEADRAAAIEQLARERVGFGFDGVLRDGGPRDGGLLGGGPRDRETEAQLRSPRCGDEVTVRVRVIDGVVVSLRWEGHGCVVSTAAAGALAALAPGVDARVLHDLIARHTSAVQAGGAPDDALGDAVVFAGIGRYPLRASCATLAWRAAAAALGPA